MAINIFLDFQEWQLTNMRAINSRINEDSFGVTIKEVSLHFCSSKFNYEEA